MSGVTGMKSQSLDAQEKAGSEVYVYLLTAVAAVGGLLFGFDTAVISGAIVFITN